MLDLHIGPIHGSLRGCLDLGVVRMMCDANVSSTSDLFKSSDHCNPPIKAPPTLCWLLLTPVGRGRSNLFMVPKNSEPCVAMLYIIFSA